MTTHKVLARRGRRVFCEPVKVRDNCVLVCLFSDEEILSRGACQQQISPLSFAILGLGKLR
jgi:hypothetical protein